MFDKYLIDETSLRNVGPAEAPTGFAFETKLGYYRGLGLSMIEELAVSVDGVAIDRGGVTFDEFCGEGGPGPLTLDEMETAYDRRWPFGAAATISVAYPGGYPAGEHELSLLQRLRVSYLPFPSINTDAKIITLRL